jgi:DNA-binding CsgD family transcriptional regulator
MPPARGRRWVRRWICTATSWPSGMPGGRLRGCGRFDVRLGGWGLQRRQQTGWLSLTEMEQQVAGMVAAAGQPHPDTAAQLCISRRTVDSHVSRILAKLHLSSRWEVKDAAEQAVAAPRPRQPLRPKLSPLQWMTVVSQSFICVVTLSQMGLSGTPCPWSVNFVYFAPKLAAKDAANGSGTSRSRSAPKTYAGAEMPLISTSSSQRVASRMARGDSGDIIEA